MRSERLYTLLEANPLAIPVILVALIIFFGGIGVYLAEYKHQDANITNLGDAFWWAIVTITTVGYGEFFPLTFVGRAIGGISNVLRNWYRCNHSRYHFTEKNQGFRVNVKIKD
ncbi:MAG: potassium channel family protein [Nitrososphaeraceae archaeon]